MHFSSRNSEVAFRILGFTRGMRSCIACRRPRADVKAEADEMMVRTGGSVGGEVSSRLGLFGLFCSASIKVVKTLLFSIY